MKFELLPKANLYGHDTRVWCARWRPSKQTACPQIASCGGQRILLWEESQPGSWCLKTIIWNRKSSQPHRLISPPAPVDASGVCHVVVAEELAISPTSCHTKTIRSISWSPDGSKLAAASFDGSVSIWKEGTHGTWELFTTVTGHENEVKCADWNFDGTLLATCSRDKSVWVHSISDDGDADVLRILKSHKQDVKSVIWHPKYNLLVSTSADCSVLLWNPFSDEEISEKELDNYASDGHDDDICCMQRLSDHTGTVWLARFSPSGLNLATCSSDKTVQIWKATLPLPSKRQFSLQAELFSSIQITPAARLVSANPLNQYTQAWEKCEWKSAFSIQEKHSRDVYAIAWHPLLDIIATGCADDCIRIFVQEAESWELLTVIDGAHTSDVNYVEWRPMQEESTEWALVSAGDDGIVCLTHFKFDPDG